MAADMGQDAIVQLTRMEGKLDLMAERHENMKEDIRKIEAIHTQAVARIDDRLQGHGNRLTSLENDKHERTGAMWAIKGIWAAAGIIVTAIVAAVLRHFSV